MTIELLYFEGCPSWQRGLELLQAVLEAENINCKINLIRIEDDLSAEKEKFLGSPSFRIKGLDLWPEERQEYHLGCRIYRTSDGLRGYPDIDMLRYKIKEILKL